MEIPENIVFTLNALSQPCPMPIILTSKKMKEIKPDEVLKVLSDDAGIKKDMPAWCKSTKNEYIGVVEKNGIYEVYVRKR